MAGPLYGPDSDAAMCPRRMAGAHAQNVKPGHVQSNKGSQDTEVADSTRSRSQRPDQEALSGSAALSCAAMASLQLPITLRCNERYREIPREISIFLS